GRIDFNARRPPSIRCRSIPRHRARTAVDAAGIPSDHQWSAEPGIAVSVLGGVVGVEVDEASLDEEVPDLEHVAPAAGLPLVDAGPPGAVAMDAVAGALAGEGVGAAHDPVEIRVVVHDLLDRPAHV